MKHWRRYGALALAAVLCLSLLSGCGEEAEERNDLQLSVCVGDEPETLDPAMAETDGDVTLVEQLYENLMRVSAGTSGNTVDYGMAKSYSSTENEDGTVTYTFRLRKAQWSDGTDVTAEDFVYAWQRLADPKTDSPNASLLSVVQGYDTVRAGGELSALAVSAKNESTLVVTLTGKYDWFLTDVCTAAATMPLRKSVVEAQSETDEDSGKAEWDPEATELVTNGLYTVTAAEDDTLTLGRSETYYDQEAGPAEIVFHFADSTEEGWALYSAGTVDFLGELPEAEYEKLNADVNRQPTLRLSAQCLLFNMSSDPFDDPLVRQAFSTAVDYQAVTEAAGTRAVTASALVPAGVPGLEADEDFRTAGGSVKKTDADSLESRCKEAAELMDQAGYGNGKNFPAVELLCQESQKAVMDVIAQTWREALNVTVTVRAVSAQELAQALEGGSYTVASAQVRSLVNDAEGFLLSWQESSEENAARYSNSAYETLLKVIAGASDASARQACLHDAESLLLEDNVVCPLYHTGTAWKLRENLSGLCRDARGWFSFRNVNPAA